LHFCWREGTHVLTFYILRTHTVIHIGNFVGEQASRVFRAVLTWWEAESTLRLYSYIKKKKQSLKKRNRRSVWCPCKLTSAAVLFRWIRFVARTYRTICMKVIVSHHETRRNDRYFATSTSKFRFYSSENDSRWETKHLDFHLKNPISK